VWDSPFINRGTNKQAEENVQFPSTKANKQTHGDVPYLARSALFSCRFFQARCPTHHPCRLKGCPSYQRKTWKKSRRSSAQLSDWRWVYESLFWSQSICFFQTLARHLLHEILSQCWYFLQVSVNGSDNRCRIKSGLGRAKSMCYLAQSRIAESEVFGWSPDS